MRPYAELVIQERDKLYRLIACLFCVGQMLHLIIYFSHRWPHMETYSHFSVIMFLLFYPLIALYSLRKQPDPFIIAFGSYALLGMGIILLTLPT